ncbi:hypothetical protein [Actinospongicola halichondriae]|uniref:hypothetical protein n=1 Tax=Actinospongicola halichondriae TaxID=3236844 RepID=UPI003D50F327
MRSSGTPFLWLALVAGVFLFAGCGDDDAASNDGGGETSPSADESSTPAADDGDPAGDAGDAESDVTVTVDGTVYAVTTVQECSTETDLDRETDVGVYGYAETGERVELVLSYQGAETSPTGTDQYFGRVGISSGELSASVTADEPFDFLTDDRSSVVGSLEMETSTEPIRTIDVDIDVTCP